MTKTTPRFIALRTPASQRQALQCFSPKIMEWSPGQWIIDVSHYYGYWKAYADKHQVTVSQVWRELLQHHHTDTTLPASFTPSRHIVPLHPSYQATHASSPWAAILLLTHMHHQNLHGLLSLDTSSSKQLYTAISWDTWWQCVDQGLTHFKSPDIQQKHRQSFPRYQRLFKESYQRFNWHSPAATQQLSYPSLRRRYGPLLAEFWHWTHHYTAPHHNYPFPWHDHKPSIPIRCHRHLDYLITNWDTLAPLLQDDLDKLTQQLPSQNHRVIQLQWTLSFDTDQQEQLICRFRHPHSLHQEIGHHTTALLQLNYAFSAFKKMAINLAPLRAWTLVITDYATLPTLIMDLFGNIRDDQSPDRLLHQLENELPIELNRYYYHPDKQPENSFSTTAQDDTHLVATWTATARYRPLMLLKKAQPIPAPSLDYSKQTERVSDNWWEFNTTTANRHYIKWIGPNGKAYWLYKTDQNKWFYHGLFS